MDADKSSTSYSAYTNADLSELARILDPNKRIEPTPQMRAFNTAFRNLVLSPELYFPLGPVSRDLPLNRMVEAVFADVPLGSLLANALRRQVRTWMHEPNGLPLKAMIDAIVQPKGDRLIGLKATDSTSYAEFEASCSELDYDREAAFNLAAVPDSRLFEFIGVQRQEPYEVFRVTYSRTDPFIQTGITKMNNLLEQAFSESKRDGGWIPSSWGGRLEGA
jgi:hypothetical protein